MSEVTRMLSVIEAGELRTAEELLPAVYAELRQLAACRMSRERPGQTLQATALVHEAWLRLEHTERRQWNNPRHFFGAAAQIMRRILVERARRRQCWKHGGHLERLNADHLDIASPLPDDQLLAVDEALERLSVIDARAAEVVHLRFFAGLTGAQVAEHLGISLATVGRTWGFARAWLFNEIQHDLDLLPGVSDSLHEDRR